MPVYEQNFRVSHRDLYQSLRAFSSSKLKQMKADLEDVIADNIHATSTDEVGRSEQTELLAEVHKKHTVIVDLLYRRGELSTEEMKQIREGAPVTEVQVRFAPNRRFIPGVS